MWTVGEWTISRVPDPGFELVLPQERDTIEALRQSPWLHPDFVTDDWSLRVGSSALIVRGPELVVVVDPWLAFDDPARFEPRLESLQTAGVTPQDVDLVVNSHVDGIGANTRPESGERTFANARYLVPAAEIDAIRGGERVGAESLVDLAAAGVVEPISAPVDLADGLSVIDLPGHSAGHVGVRVGSPVADAVIAGHLFLHPAQIANTQSAIGDLDPTVLRRTREAFLHDCVERGTLLIGPLFASPGAGRVIAAANGWALEAAPASTEDGRGGS